MELPAAPREVPVPNSHTLSVRGECRYAADGASTPARRHRGALVRHFSPPWRCSGHAGSRAAAVPSRSRRPRCPTASSTHGHSQRDPDGDPGVLLAAGTIYLADAQQQLVAVPVQVPDGQAAPMLQTLLNRLAVGPSDQERARGLVTDLGPGSTIVLRSISSGTANIELQSTGQDPSPSKLPVAVGQIVLTATSIVGIDRVVFARDGVAMAVPGERRPHGRPRRVGLRRAAGPDSRR